MHTIAFSGYSDDILSVEITSSDPIRLTLEESSIDGKHEITSGEEELALPYRSDEASGGSVEISVDGEPYAILHLILLHEGWRFDVRPAGPTEDVVFAEGTRREVADTDDIIVLSFPEHIKAVSVRLLE